MRGFPTPFVVSQFVGFLGCERRTEGVASLEDVGGDDAVPSLVLGVEQDDDEVEAAEERTGEGRVDAHRLRGATTRGGVLVLLLYY